MNYFELYPGDYLRDTTRLTLIEHGAYLRLLMAYYAEEEPLPAEYDLLFTIAGATKSAEKEAVKRVADKHFPVASDGLRHNNRADEEIAKAAERIEASAERKSNDAERQKRARERRRAMFDQLREVGVTPPFNATTADLEVLVTKHVTQSRHVTGGVTGRDNGRDITRDNTATTCHTPHASKDQEQNHAPPVVSPQDSPARNGDDAPVPGEQDLPDWVPRGIWREFYRHRAVIRKPLSIPGQRQVVQRLTELREQRHDIATSLAQTIAAGLAIPVIPKDHDHADRPPGRNLSAVERVRAANERAEQREQQSALEGHARVHRIEPRGS